MKARDQIDALRAATGRTSTVLPGHALRFRWGIQVRGLCGCGERSPLFSNAHAVKAWHRQHKLDVLRATP
jgi:hypothetical protein